MTREAPTRGLIDRGLEAVGWAVQDMRTHNPGTSRNVALSEYLTDARSSDHALFVDGKPIDLINAGRAQEGQIRALDPQDQLVELCLKRADAQTKNILVADFFGQFTPQDPDNEPASVLLARICAERDNASPTPHKRRVDPRASGTPC